MPFHHLPVSAANRAEQEAQLLVVVLARYMQILSPTLCAALAGRAINIHHILPSFKGAQPYHQAHARGVKIIGATAHYVTGDLDEGPIIEQDVARVDHAMTPRELVRLGSDTESQVLARAVRRQGIGNGEAPSAAAARRSLCRFPIPDSPFPALNAPRWRSSSRCGWRPGTAPDRACRWCGTGRWCGRG
ncbi:formyltransferase family protein [Pantoea ananatis]|uniref:formyltransferase family protein n=1 Tax=Pantoea ananas TaxID=553 RepID=UPI00221E8BFB|nr:formyltransferase family protein [Pantoea ananatis]